MSIFQILFQVFLVGKATWQQFYMIHRKKSLEFSVRRKSKKPTASKKEGLKALNPEKVTFKTIFDHVLAKKSMNQKFLQVKNTNVI